ncbi:MAG: hypothetical protein KC506_03870, partial [Nanoarchaeota archaeon]|nr:hypothetical protein [Nanoarchaeota archaeon]
VLKPRGEWKLSSGKVLKIGTVDSSLIGEDYYFNVYNNVTNKTKNYWFDVDGTLNGFLEDGTEAKLLTKSNVYHSSFKEDSEKNEIRNIRDELLKYLNELKNNEIVKEKTDGEKYFDSAIGTYENVVDRYPTEDDGIYGKRALDNGIDLAKTFENDVVRQRLMKDYVETYKSGENYEGYLVGLTQINNLDFSDSSESVEFADKLRVISLVGLTRPKTASTAELDFDGRRVVLTQNVLSAFTIDGGKLDGDIGTLLAEDNNNKIRGQIMLEEVGIDNAVLSAYCVQNNNSGSRVVSTSRQRFNLRQDAEQATEICGSVVRLRDVHSERVWKIELLPNVRGTTTEANFTVNIGIEKRAIELTPDKVRSKIDNLNETIEKWGSLNDKLGNVVSGLKTACFATSGILTLKNFLTGLNGQTIARQEVMNGPGGWKERCAEKLPGASLDACFAKYAGEIDAEVAARNNAQNSVNSVILGIQNDPECIGNNNVFGKSVDNKCVNNKLAAKIVSEYGGETVKPGDNEWQGKEGEISVSKLLEGKNAEQMSSDQLRTLYSNLKERELAGGNLNADYAKRVDGSTGMIVDQVENKLVLQKAIDDANVDKAKGLAAVSYSEGSVRAADVVRVGSSARENYPALKVDGVSHTSTIFLNGTKYIVGTKEDDPVKKYYSVVSAQTEGGKMIEGSELDDLKSKVGAIRSISTITYNNKMIETDAVVRYYETEPYRGMPAFVPIDSDRGWYAATRQSIPAFGG